MNVMIAAMIEWYTLLCVDRLDVAFSGLSSDRVSFPPPATPPIIPAVPDVVHTLEDAFLWPSFGFH
eukprot:3374325-Alexandrium_andersonii.AAC.1